MIISYWVCMTKSSNKFLALNFHGKLWQAVFLSPTLFILSWDEMFQFSSAIWFMFCWLYLMSDVYYTAHSFPVMWLKITRTAKVKLFNWNCLNLVTDTNHFKLYPFFYYHQSPPSVRVREWRINLSSYVIARIVLLLLLYNHFLHFLVCEHVPRALDIMAGLRECFKHSIPRKQ